MGRPLWALLGGLASGRLNFDLSPESRETQEPKEILEVEPGVLGLTSMASGEDEENTHGKNGDGRRKDLFLSWRTFKVAQKMLTKGAHPEGH